MAENQLIFIVDDCINRLRTGQTIADCLRVYPDYAKELAPLLEAGNLYRRIQASPIEVAQSQQRVRQRFEQALAITYPRPPRIKRIFWLMAATLILLMLMLATTVAAQSSIPGDSLYEWKRISESILLILPGDTEARRSDFAQRRIDEIRQLLNLRRTADVTFEGNIVAVTDTTILLTDLPVERMRETVIDTSLRPDMRVIVDGRTTNEGRIIADRIRLSDTNTVPVNPTATGTSTPTDTARRTATTTPTREATATLTHEPSSAPTESSTRSPTRLPATDTPQPSTTPVPTATPTEAGACIPTAPAGWVAYTVQSGDTLSELALNTDTTIAAVMDANCLDSAGRIITGTRIYLPRQPIRTVRTAASTETSRTAIPTRQPTTDSLQGNTDPEPSRNSRDGRSDTAPTEITPSRRD